MTTRTVISKSAKRKLWVTPTSQEMVFTEMVIYRTKLPNGKISSTTRHEKRK